MAEARPGHSLVQLDYWNVGEADWIVGHHSVNLKDPATYVLKLKKRGVMARTTDLDTGEEVCGPGGELL